MIRAIALVDLDDTLFQTIRKCPEDVTADRLVALGFARDGSALSFATPRQMSFLNWLLDTTLFVPVTARSLDALRRVRIPFARAICAHGGVILDETGQVDGDWARDMAKHSLADRDTLIALESAVTAKAEAMHAPLSCRVLTEDGTPLYLLVKHADGNAAALHAVVDAAVPGLPAGWTDHRNGNNVALMPPWLGKARAVERLLPSLRSQYPELSVIGIGDSLTDAPYLRLCDFAMLPTGSQLAEATPLAR